MNIFKVKYSKVSDKRPVFNKFTIQGDKLSEKNKHADRKSSLISVQQSFFPENK